MKPMEQSEAISTLLAGIQQRGNALGQREAPVTLVYFGDLECPFCRDFSVDVLPSIIQRWVRAGKLRIEYRAFQTATQEREVFVTQQVAALAAGRQAKAWHFIETFYEQQGDEGTGYVTDPYLRGIAAQIPGLDLERWADDRGEEDLIEEIASDEQAAENAGLNGTPSFLIGASGGTPARFSPSDSRSFDAAIEGLLEG